MKKYTYEWAVGSWDERANLEFVPVDVDANNKNCLPQNITGVVIPSGRLPYKMEDTGAGVYYVTYSSAPKAQIIRITEVEE
jgi:hypothetical protein